MDETTSPSGLFGLRLKMPIFLAQTDTTVGFLSQDAKSLASLKERDEGKPFLKVCVSFFLLQTSLRVPLKYRSWVRHAQKTTFVIQDQAIRYVNDPHHAPLIAPYGWLYSTSANKSGEGYDPQFCRTHADRIIEDSRGFFTTSPSKIIRLTSTQFQKLR